METVVCPNCGANASSEDFTCAKCGVILNELATSDEPVSLVEALLAPANSTSVRSGEGDPSIGNELTVRATILMDEFTVPRLLQGIDLALKPLTPFEAYVASFIDGAHSVPEIAAAAEISKLEAMAILQTLAFRDVVEIKRDESRKPGQAPELDEEPKTDPNASAEDAGAAPELGEEPRTPVDAEPSEESHPPAGTADATEGPDPVAAPSALTADRGGSPAADLPSAPTPDSDSSAAPQVRGSTSPRAAGSASAAADSRAASPQTALASRSGPTATDSRAGSTQEGAPTSGRTAQSAPPLATDSAPTRHDAAPALAAMEAAPTREAPAFDLAALKAAMLAAAEAQYPSTGDAPGADAEQPVLEAAPEEIAPAEETAGPPPKAPPAGPASIAQRPPPTPSKPAAALAGPGATANASRAAAPPARPPSAAQPAGPPRRPATASQPAGPPPALTAAPASKTTPAINTRLGMPARPLGTDSAPTLNHHAAPAGGRPLSDRAPTVSNATPVPRPAASRPLASNPPGITASKTLGGSAPTPTASRPRAQPLEERAPQGSSHSVEYTLERAIALERRGDFDGAVYILKKAIAQSSHAAPLYNKLALALVKRKEFKEAVSMLEKAVELAPDDTTYQQNLYKVMGLTASTGKGRKDDKSGVLSGLFKRK